MFCASSTKDTYAFIFGIVEFDRAEKIGNDLYEWHFSKRDAVVLTPINRAGQGWFNIEIEDLDIWDSKRDADFENLPYNIVDKLFEERLNKKTGKLIPKELKSTSKVGLVF